MKLKELEKKHDHKLTEWLKVIIFGLLMLAPLFASISQMLYATFNKNAHESYYGETINEKQLVNVTNGQLKQSTKYYCYQNNITGNVEMRLAVSNVKILNSTQDLSSCNVLRIYINSNTPAYGFYNDTTYINWYRIDNTSIEFTYEGTINTSTYNVDYLNILQYYEYNKYSYLDNAFYYGVDQMTKSDLFNWTQNTAIYTGVKAMTDNLQIQTPVVAILIVYWFILTIIYIIIDIVLALFTKLTHFMN